MANCPYCAEQIQPGLTTCPHCQSSLTPAPPGPAPRKSNAAIWLVVIGGIVLSGVCVVGILIALLLPAVQQAREAARRSACKNNLKQIGLALYNYNDTYGTFPPAYIPDSTGKPMHSWRVLILPFIDQMPMHDAYDFSQPWDSPQNMAITQHIPEVFICPSSPNHSDTHYVLITGKDTCFDGSKAIKAREISDGTSQTLFVVEARESGIHWSEPRDYDTASFTAPGDPGGLSSYHLRGFNALFGDGSVRFINESTNVQILKGLITPSGGEVIGEF